MPGKIFVKPDYTIIVPDVDTFKLGFPFTAKHAAAKFKHPAIIESMPDKLEFKHSSNSGSKHWTSESGIIHYLTVRRQDVEIIPKQGHSYVFARINGAEVVFNVSGGTSPDGWSDWLRPEMEMCANHKLTDFEKVCAVAVSQPRQPTLF
jgi:hypothetical protein